MDLSFEVPFSRFIAYTPFVSSQIWSCNNCTRILTFLQGYQNTGTWFLLFSLYRFLVHQPLASGHLNRLLGSIAIFNLARVVAIVKFCLLLAERERCELSETFPPQRLSLLKKCLTDYMWCGNLSS